MKCSGFPREFRRDKPWRNGTSPKQTLSGFEGNIKTRNRQPETRRKLADRVCVISKARGNVQPCFCSPGPWKTQVPEAAWNLESPSVDAGPSRPRVTCESNVKGPVSTPFLAKCTDSRPTCGLRPTLRTGPLPLFRILEANISGAICGGKTYYNTGLLFRHQSRGGGAPTGRGPFLSVGRLSQTGRQNAT